MNSEGLEKRVKNSSRRPNNNIDTSEPNLRFKRGAEKNLLFKAPRKMLAMMG